MTAIRPGRAKRSNPLAGGIVDKEVIRAVRLTRALPALALSPS
jgi:hypothetical protein